MHRSLATGMGRLFTIAFAVGLAALLVAHFLPEIPLKHDEFYEEGTQTPPAAEE